MRRAGASFLTAAGAALLFAACSATPALSAPEPPLDAPAAPHGGGLVEPLQAGDSIEPPEGGGPAGDRMGGEQLPLAGPRQDRVLAVVDGDEIRASDLYRSFFLENPIKTRDALRSEVLYLLARKEALRVGVTVSTAAVQARLEEMIAEHRARCAAYADSSATLEQVVAEQYGMSFTEYRDHLERTALFNLLLDRCVRYREMQARRYTLGVIVVDERSAAEDIRAKLERGANFEALARQHSRDRSAQRGGVLTPIPDDPRHPLHGLVERVRGLRAGEIGPVDAVEVPAAAVYRILKVIAVAEPIAGAFEAGPVEASLGEYPVDLAALDYWQLCLAEEYPIEVKPLHGGAPPKGGD